MFNHTSPPEFYSKKESEMKQYTIGLITGALLAISAMMFMGAQYTTYDIDDVYRKVKFVLIFSSFAFITSCDVGISGFPLITFNTNHHIQHHIISSKKHQILY